MEYLTLARVIHVLAIVLWIGGVSMVTTVLIPAIKRMKSKEEQIETFTAPQAVQEIRHRKPGKDLQFRSPGPLGAVDLKPDHHHWCPGRKSWAVLLLG